MRRSVPSRLAVDDPDRALDDDDELVADLALAHERLVRRVDVLRRRSARSAGGPRGRGPRTAARGAASSIVSRSPRVAARLGHRPSLLLDPLAPGPDPRVVIIAPAGRATASRSPARRRRRPRAGGRAPGSSRSPIESSASIACARTSGSSEREAAPDDAAGLGCAEDDQRAEGQVRSSARSRLPRTSQQEGE